MVSIHDLCKIDRKCCVVYPRYFQHSFVINLPPVTGNHFFCPVADI